MSTTYVIYARKSTESEDRQVLSIDSQIQELKLLAARRGIQPPEVMTESHSAKAPGRPVFGQLIRRIKKGELAGVFCWKMDRLARNHLDTGQVLQALADGKLPAVITPERTYTADGNDRFLGNFELGIATKFIDDLRANVRRGNRARFQRGWPNFRPPVGYLEDRATKTVVKDPERYDLIRRAWDLLLSGAARPSQILTTLNHQWGFRSRKTARMGGKLMAMSALYGVFANPFYKGLLRIKGGETYRGAHEPMVTPEEFDRAQELLGRPSQPRPWRHEFAYAGLLRCRSCRRPMVGEEHVKPSGKRYVYYRCHRTGSAERCAEPTLPETAFDQQLEADLRRMALPPRAAAWILRNLKKSLSTETNQLDAARIAREKALRTALSEGDNLLTLRLRGLVDDEAFEKRRLEILDRQATIRLELDRPACTPGELLSRIERVLRFSKEAPGYLKTGTPVQRRQVVQAVCSNLEVSGRKALYSAKKPFSTFRDAREISGWQPQGESNPCFLDENQVS